MKYWLVKTEPDVFSFDDLLKEGISTWDGVRNYQARNNLKAMQINDLVLVYHSNVGKEIVGIAKVVQTFFPDPTTDDSAWVAVKLAPVAKVTRPLSLSEIKSNLQFKDLLLIKNPRLSVMPIEENVYFMLLDLTK